MAQIIKGNEKTTYVYDDENRLTSVFSATNGQPSVLVASYSYDGDGGRTKKEVNRRDKAVFNSKETTAFMYKDYNGKAWPGTIKNPKRIVTRYVGQLYEEEDPGSDGQLRKTKYIYLGSTRIAAVSTSTQSMSSLPDRQAGPNALIGDPEVRYYHTDHLGGTNVLTDKTGLPKQLTEYDPFGLIIKSEDYGAPSAALWHYFTSKPLDDETGLMYYGARYYNPKLGRFITPDTIVQSPGNPQTLNRYTYCNNNPVNLIDPTGHSWWKKMFKAVGSFFKAAVQMVAYAVLSPIITPVGAGLVVGFISGGLGGGGWSWEGALMGAAMGGLGGAAFGSTGANGFLGSMGKPIGFALMGAGAIHAGVTGGVEGLVGYSATLAGGVGGAKVGGAIVRSQGYQSFLKGIQSGQVAARSAGTNTPIGARGNNAQTALNTDRGSEATGQQALSNGRAKISVAIGTPGGSLSPDPSPVTVEGGSKVVFGKYPDYLNVADKLGAERFSMPDNVWSSMSAAQQEVANKTFVYAIVEKGSSIVFSNSPSSAQPGSSFAKEIGWLRSLGVDTDKVPVIPSN